MNIIEYIKDVNIFLVVLDILFLVISFLFLNKKKCNDKVKDLFVILYTLFNLFLFSYFNNLFQNIFTLKFLSIKNYLVIVLITLFIFLYTFNKNLKIVYKIINYLLMLVISIILGINIFIVITSSIKFYNIIDISYSITLMNVSFIVCICYLCLIGLGYIGYDLYDRYLIKNKKAKKNKVVEKKMVKNSIDSKEVTDKNNSLEELFKYRVGDSFYINGIDCNIIFCDSNKENIVKNYNILSSDINARMVNGYTLEENIKIKDICNKLNVSNLSSINLDNFSILNIISVDEYNFLREIFSKK